MTEQTPVSFARLLRRLRTDAGMTQEELAEAAKLSPRSVSDLERGINLTARRETARLLADALNLASSARADFELAARGRVPADGPPARLAAVGGPGAATRTLPRDIASFTGREAELRHLVDAVARSAGTGGVVGICAIGGMAGIGKTAFAVHAAHRLASRFPDGQIFLPLHGHTPGQRPVEPADALASLLLTAGVAAPQIPPGLDARTRLWRDHLAGMRLLLVLDDAVGHDQVRPLLPGTAGSLVLLTSRKNLTALEARTISLDILPPDEAAALLITLADRPGLEPADAPVGEITRMCGYLPLAIGMLARQLHHHPAWTCRRLAADLAAARDRLELMHAENLSVAATFDLSYQDLTASQQRLFRRLGLHPGADIDAHAAAALDDTGLAAARLRLEALYDQHLLTEPAQGRYRLHDLLREHARTRVAADPAADCSAAVGRLLDYYLHTARAASRHTARRSPGHVPAVTAIPPACAPDLPDHESAVSWMDAERLNLHAAATYASLHDQYDHSIALPAAMHSFLLRQGYWDQAIALHHAALKAAGDAGDQLAEAGALTDLGDLQQLTGDYPAAAANLTRALKLYRRLDHDLGEARALNELGVVQRIIGTYPRAAASHEQALKLYRGLGNKLGEASARSELGVVQLSMGDYPASAASHEQALQLHRDLGNKLGEASALNRLGLVHRATGDYPAAAASHEQALQLHRHLGNKLGEGSALGALGAVQQAMGDYPAAAASYEQALRLHRHLGYRLGEAHTLRDLSTLQQATGDHPAAAASHEQALRLYRELGHRLGRPEALNELGIANQAIADYEAPAASQLHELRPDIEPAGEG